LKPENATEHQRASEAAKKAAMAPEAKLRRMEGILALEASTWTEAKKNGKKGSNVVSFVAIVKGLGCRALSDEKRTPNPAVEYSNARTS